MLLFSSSDWLVETSRDPKFETKNEKELDALLTLFYQGVRSKNGKKYSKSMMLGIRASLSKYLLLPPQQKNFNIILSPLFDNSNKMLKLRKKYCDNLLKVYYY